MTYWQLNVIFLTVVAVVVLISVLRFRRGNSNERIRWRAIAFTAVVTFAMTAIFDNIMIQVGLFGYDPQLTADARLGVMPFEDFAYPLAAVLLLPAIWALSARRPQKLEKRAKED